MDHGNPMLLVNAHLQDIGTMMRNFPKTGAAARDAMIYDCLLGLLPLDKQFCSTSGEHFLLKHADRKYAIVASMTRNYHSHKAVHSNSTDPNSPTIGELINARILGEEPDDGFMETCAMVNSITLLSSRVNQELLEWMAMRQIKYKNNTITITADEVPRWINAVVNTDNYSSIFNINVVTREGKPDQKFNVEQMVPQMVVRPLLDRWLHLQKVAPDYLALIADSVRPLLVYIKQCNGFHGLAPSEIAMLRVVAPGVLQTGWESASPMERGLYSLTVYGLIWFSGIRNHHHYNHPLIARKISAELLASNPTDWFERMNADDSRDYLLKDVIQCNEENSLGHRIDSYSKNDYIISHNITGTHCHYFTREEYPILAETSRNFYTSEPLHPMLVVNIKKVLSDLDSAWVLPSRPWIENWNALQNGEWICPSPTVSQKMRANLNNWQPKCSDCGVRHSSTPILGYGGRTARFASGPQAHNSPGTGLLNYMMEGLRRMGEVPSPLTPAFSDDDENGFATDEDNVISDDDREDDQDQSMDVVEVEYPQ